MTTRAATSATDLAAVIVAGGLSSRIGRDKSLLPLGSVSMLERIVERLRPQVARIDVNTNAVPPPRMPHGVTAFADTVNGRLGPLAGVLSALRHTRTHCPGQPSVMTVPTDTPFFPMDLAVRLAASRTRPGEIAIAHTNGTMHPIFGLWPVAIADDLEDFLLSDEKRRVRGFIARHPMIAVNFATIETTSGPFDPFYNINTPKDHAEAECWLARLETGKP